MKVLVIASHPDDEVLGCGGTMAKLAKEGHEIELLILGEGLTSRPGSATNSLASLHSDALKSAQVLGVRDVHFENLPDNRFDGLELLDIVKKIEGHMHRFKPEWVFTQHGGDLNLDHSITFRATLTAARPLPHSSLRAIYAYEVPSSTEWAFQKIAPPFEPNLFFDISPTLSKKLEAMGCYSSEMRPFPHPRSEEALTAVARRWGSVVGTAAAEAFQVIWEKR
jgi:LmbE family N-acetylglucosaminyl deacetylase